jgi:hypothetical protein
MRAIALIIATLSVIGTALAASLQNTDSQPYELVITEPGRPSASYRIIENSQVEICFLGCEMTLLSTGQTVSVGPKDTVAIDSGVMTVTSE